MYFYIFFLPPSPGPAPIPKTFPGSFLQPSPKPIDPELRNPVEPDLALYTIISQTFSGTFSGTLLNLTWLCTKASQTFFGTFGTFSETR